MNETVIINGIEYKLFSCESANYGGISKKDAIELLKDAGIKVSGKDAYTSYVGHYGLWVESSKSDEASKILFG